MKLIFQNILTISIALIINLGALFSQSIVLAGTNLKFADYKTAVNKIKAPDEYTASFGYFDLISKTRNYNAESVDDYLEFTGKQVREWTEDDYRNVFDACQVINRKIKELGIKLNLPSEIYLIKTTGLEEGGASGYTRSNFIVLTESEKITEHLILHELFHIFSRYNPEMRDSLYGVIGFKPMNGFRFPELLNNIEISNPDCPAISHYIDILMPDSTKAKATTFFYSPNDYKGGSFLDYADLGMLILEEVEEGIFSPKLDKTGMPIIINPSKVHNFIEQIGLNTNYIIHPEEICAENFVQLIMAEKKSPSMIIIDKFYLHLSK